MLNSGYFCYYGLYVRKDKDKALYWYKKAYMFKHAAAASNIAIIYKERKDWRKMLWWFHKAVALGDGDALYEIATLYHKGIGVKRNIKKAISYYKKALDMDSYYITEDTIDKIKRIMKRLS